jgi:hypothetical protein
MRVTAGGNGSVTRDLERDFGRRYFSVFRIDVKGRFLIFGQQPGCKGETLFKGKSIQPGPGQPSLCLA